MPPIGTSSLVYTHDAWDRLVKVEYDDGSTLHPRGEYEYNGLNWRTVKRCDSDLGDQTHELDQERVMYYSPSWQLLEERIDEDFDSSPGTDRVQQYVWGIRYIDDIVLHRQDNNADGDYADPASGGGIGGGAPKAADATYYHLTDAQFSTVAIINDDAEVQERVTYSAYGIARHHWPHDVDGDGNADATDVNIISTIAGGSNNLIGQSNYRAECDLDRDGDVDSTDTAIATGLGAKAALRYGELSAPGSPSGSPPGTGVDNIIGFDGYVYNTEAELYHVRFRWYSPELGRWLERDPAGYVDGQNLYLYVRGNPTRFIDPTGQELIVEGDAQFVGNVSRALDKLCPEATIKKVRDNGREKRVIWIDKPANGYEATKQDRWRVRDAQKKAKREGRACKVGPDPDCKERPGCELLECLINDKSMHRIRETRRGEIDRNDPVGDGHTDTAWSGRSRDRRWSSKDFLAFEVLYHELIHACHRATGTIDTTETKPGEFGWEEVQTIEANNKLREWYNKCGKFKPTDPDVDWRDPYDHPYSRDLNPSARPGVTK